MTASWDETFESLFEHVVKVHRVNPQTLDYQLDRDARSALTQLESIHTEMKEKEAFVRDMRAAFDLS